MFKLLTSIALLLLIQQCRPIIAVTVKEFFKNLNGNLMKITWAHAVDSASLLDQALHDYNVMMLQTDVSFDADQEIPIISNTPTANRILSLEEFMQTLSEFNQQNYGHGKGVKLSFKSIDALKNSVDCINKYKDQFPIWIHGDIINDYQVRDATALDAGEFLDICIPLINVQFSFGWSTPLIYRRPAPETFYTSTLISRMDMTVRQFDASRHNLIFSVRAGLVANANSAKAIKDLLSWRYGSTLTIWSLENDYVSIVDLNRLINDIGVDKVYLDVPDKLRKQIVINN